LNAAVFDELRQGCNRSFCGGSASGSKQMFIVQGKPRSPQGILKVIKHTRREAMQAANDLLAGGMAFVTIIAEGRVYTVEEFALTILDPRD
jgi:hypothetical protein